MIKHPERLSMLADFLEGVGPFEGRGVPEHKFHLEYWMAAYELFSEIQVDPNTGEVDYVPPRKFKATKSDQKIFEFEDYLCDSGLLSGLFVVTPIDCQTAGCAVGWAATIPEFKELGLKLYVRSFTGRAASPYYKGKKDIEAVSDFFGLPPTHAAKLFDPAYYTVKDDPKVVAERIRLYVAGKIDLTLVRIVD